MIKKDNYITNITDKYFKVLKIQDYMDKFLKDNKFDGPDDLENFKQDTQDENIVKDIVLETDIKESINKDNLTTSPIITNNIVEDTSSDLNENIDRETIIVDDIIEDIKTKEISLEIETDVKNLSKEDTTSEDKSLGLNKNNEELPFKGCPIVTINNKSELEIEWKEHVSTEIFRIIEDNKILNEKINKDKYVDKKALNEAIDYMIIKRNIKNIKSNRNHIRNSIKRSYELFNIHKEDLKYVTFSFDKMIRLSNDNWIKFLDYIDLKIKKVHEIRTFENIIEEPSTPIIDNKFNYNYILNNKKALLFEENDKLYTYNFYEEKVIADVPDGDCCMKCGYIRFTTSGCCIYRNCENRKRCKSKYNKTEEDELLLEIEKCFK